MAGKTSIRDLLKQGMNMRYSGIVIGTVISASPIKIQVENDSKLILTDTSLYIPKYMTDHKVSVKLSGSTGYTSSPESHRHSLGSAEMTVYNALKTGETVYLLAFNEGQLYYVMDRLEG